MHGTPPICFGLMVIRSTDQACSCCRSGWHGRNGGEAALAVVASSAYLPPFRCGAEEQRIIGSRDAPNEDVHTLSH